MTTTKGGGGTPGRRRDADDARRRLLTAADELFAERGYDRTTTRDIGSRAQIDPALIARYFGSKSALYLAAMRGGGQPHRLRPLDLTDATDIEQLLSRADGREPGPRPGSTLYAVVRPHDQADLQAEAMAFLEQRLLANAEKQARDAGLDNPRLRAETATAAFIGMLLSRTAGTLHELAAADPAALADLITQMLRTITTSH